MGAIQFTTMKERAQALLAGAVTVAMAASLATVGAPVQHAYADEDVAVAVQAADAVTVTDVQELTAADTGDRENNYIGGVRVSLDVPDGVELDMANSVTLNGMEYTAIKSLVTAGAEKAFFPTSESICLTKEALVKGENSLYVDLDESDGGSFTVTFTYPPETQEPSDEVQRVDVEWSVDYRVDEYGIADTVILAPAGAGAKLPSGYKKAVESVTAGDYSYAAAEYGSVYGKSEYAVTDYAITIGLGGLKDGPNDIVVKADGYEDVVLTVYYNGAKKIASFEEIPAGLAAGAYTATYAMYAEGTENASHAAAYFDGNIKIDVADDGTIKATVLNVSSASMIKDVALGTSKDAMASGQRTELVNGAVEYVISIPDTDSTYKIGFAMNAGPHSTEVGDYANYTYADLKFAEVNENWTGYASVVPFGTEATGLLRGTAVTIPNRGAIVTPSIYTLPVSLMHATKDQASMAASALPQAAQLSIDDKGNATLRLTLAPVKVMGQVGYASGIKAYVGAAASGDTVDATVVSTQKTNKGEDVPHVVEIPVPAAAQAIDGVYISMFVDAMGSSVSAFVKVAYPQAAVLDSADVKAVEEANAAIAAIPALDDLTVADKETVAKARTAVDDLTEIQKNLTSDVAVADAEARIGELEKAADEAAAAKAEADLAYATVTVAKASVAYTGKALKPGITVKSKSGKELKAGTDYTVSYSANKNVGTAKVVVKGAGSYAGEKAASFKITQAANKAKAAKTSVKKSFKKAAVKKKAQSVALPKVTTTFGKAKWSVAKKDAKKVLSLKNGKVVVKKGAKPDTYTIKLKASVAETKNYKTAATKVVTVKVTVKK